MTVVEVATLSVFWLLWPLVLTFWCEWPNRYRLAFRGMVESWVYLPAVTMLVLIAWAGSPGHVPPLVLIPWGAHIAWGYYRKGTAYAPLRGYRLTRDNHEVIE